MLRPVLDARPQAPLATANGHSIGPVTVICANRAGAGFVLPSQL